MNKEQVVEKAQELANKKISDEARSKLYLDSKTKGVLDAMQEKVVSRKLLVFMTATFLFIWSGLDPDTWGMIAMIYIGGQTVIDAAISWKHGK